MKHKSVFLQIFAATILLALVLVPLSTRNSFASEGRGGLEGASIVSDIGESPTGLYIIRLVDESIASYSGGIQGLSGTSNQVTGVRKLDVKTPGSVAYLTYLDGKHNALISAMEQTLGREIVVRFQYLNVLNAMAVEMSADEAAKVASLDGVRNVWVDAIQELDTDVGPFLINADSIWDGDTSSGLDTKGEGVIVGVIDSGINSDHPSFAATGGDGYTHTNPYGSGTYVGICDPGDPNHQPGFCNDKLIGAYSFNAGTVDPEDVDGHGSHTASTAAGNVHDAVFTVGTEVYTRTISGVAPHANVIAFLVCLPGCPTSSSIAAINQGIIDGVDVYNFSISGSGNPWNDSVDLAFLDAFNAGVFPSVSAGNSGPGPSTVAHNGPWQATTGANTHNRVIGNGVDVTGPSPVPMDLEGLAAVPGTGPTIASDIEDDIEYSGNIDAGNINGCAAFPANSFDGLIALIQRGGCTFQVKVDNADNAGAIATIVFNNVGGPPISMGGLETTNIPAVFLSLEDGEAVRDWINAAGSTPTARINAGTVLVQNDDWEDIMAGFSSRGPAPVDVLKPSYTAPGVNILAAVSTSNPSDPPEYGFLQGTSMSSPHSAGSAALITALHPDWSPAQILAAMMLTAETDGIMKEDGTTPADPFDMGAGRIDLRAAGHTAMTMEETYANMVAANPGLGGDPTTLNIASYQNDLCDGTCSFTRVLSSTISTTTQWEAVVTAPPTMTVTVSPSSFTLSGYLTQSVDIDVDVSGFATGIWEFAEVRFVETTSYVFLPLMNTGDGTLGNSGHVPSTGHDAVPTYNPDVHLPIAVQNNMAPPGPCDVSSPYILGDSILGGWSDDFDSYATDFDLHNVGGWRGWGGDPNASACTRDEQSRSAPNSVEVLGAVDLIQEFSGLTSGSHIITAYLYVPSGYSGQSYFILLNSYDDACATCNWSLQLQFDSGSGNVVNEGGASGGSMPYITDQWVEIRVEVDLDADTQSVYYNNVLLFSGTWTNEVSGGGALNIAVIDLFANNASAVYYDDFSVQPAP